MSVALSFILILVIVMLGILRSQNDIKHLDTSSQSRPPSRLALDLVQAIDRASSSPEGVLPYMSPPGHPYPEKLTPEAVRILMSVARASEPVKDDFVDTILNDTAVRARLVGHAKFVAQAASGVGSTDLRRKQVVRKIFDSLDHKTHEIESRMLLATWASLTCNVISINSDAKKLSIEAISKMEPVIRDADAQFTPSLCQSISPIINYVPEQEISKITQNITTKMQSVTTRGGLNDIGRSLQLFGEYLPPTIASTAIDTVIRGVESSGQKTL